MSFKKLLSASGNKPPPGYEGAYEKHKKAIKTSVLLNDDEPSDDEEVEFDETELLNLKGLLCTPCSAPPTTSNAFAALTEEEDEDAVVAALCQLTSNVNVGPKMSQRQRTEATAKKGLTVKEIRRIAAAVNRGDVELPDVDLEDNEEYEAVWALVDTGAGANVASLKNQFPGATMNEHDPSVPLIKLSTASAEILDGGGNFTIRASTGEGHDATTTFVDAPVDMPILSVAQICEDGHRVIFNKKGGVIWNSETGEKTVFIKRRGVYFLKMLVPRSLVRTSDMDFARPGGAYISYAALL